MQAELLTTLCLHRAPANEAYPVDIDNDGNMEFLFLQSPGLFQSRIFNPDRRYWDKPYGPHGRTRRDDCCLTAMDRYGSILWQYGEPKPYIDGAECFTHCADQMLYGGDISGQGRCEVALLHRDRLLLLDGRTGDIVRQTELDSDNYCIVLPVHTRQGTRLLVKNKERAFAPHWYGDPALILDDRLNIVARIPTSVGSGHSPRAFDVNDDGNDEILIGYEAYDADGNHLWRLDAVDENTYDPEEEHVDQLQVCRIGDRRGTQEPRIVYAGSFNAYAATLDGHAVWERHLGHPQHVAVGNFGAGSRAQLAFLANNLRNNIFYLRHDGKIVNVITPPVHWPELPESRPKAHSGEGFLVYPQGAQDGTDVLITRDWGWPHAVDMLGGEPFSLPFPGSAPYDVACPRSRDEDRALREEHMPCGLPLCPRESYGVRIGDFDGDGRAEVLIHNLREAWVYKPPYPRDDAPSTHARLEPVTGQGWYAW